MKTTGTLHLHDWPELPTGVSTAGSLYSLPAGERLRAARELADAGWWVHVDLIVRDGDPDAGVPRELLPALARTVPGDRLEVHLMTAGATAPGPDSGTDLLVNTVLAEALACAPGRVVLPAARCAAQDAATAAVRTAGASLWAQAAPADPDEVVRRAADVSDGVLLMLLEPGTRNVPDLRRLALARSLARHGPVGVDGGVGRTDTAHCLDAGITHLVTGRALLHPADVPPAR